MLPDEYLELALKTSVIDWTDKEQRKIAPLGLLGELGSLATVLKRGIRDSSSYEGYDEHLKEELGDLLWYLVIISYRRGEKLQSWPIPKETRDLFHHLLAVEESVTELMVNDTRSSKASSSTAANIHHAFQELANMVNAVGLTMASVAVASSKKIRSHWLEDAERPAARYDQNFPEYERLPRKFEVNFLELKHQDQGLPNELIISIDGMHLGDRLTDNNHEIDGYRYHDIFHLSAASCLGWSPVFRRMLKKKRKSDARIDEVEDGARAAILEEAIVGQIFAYSRTKNYLENIKRVDADLIKLIQSLVQGYEVESAEPWEWQDYILKAMGIFREVRNGFTGKISFDAEQRSIEITKS